MTEMIFEQLENSNDEKEYVITGDDHRLLIENFVGQYYRTSDSIDIQVFKGYLFYNRKL